MLNRCPLCGSDNLKGLYNVKGYHIVKCKDCNLVFVNNDIEKETLLNLYEETYFHNSAWCLLNKDKYIGYDDYIGDRENIRDKFNRIIKLIKNYTNTGPLLDVGCGPGFFLELAREKGFNPVKGIDISSYAVRYCNDKLKLDVQRGEIEDFIFDPETFNIITMFDVIEHLHTPKRVLVEINRILKIDGLLVIITPDIDTFTAKLVKNKWEEIQRVPEHLVFFSKRTITTLLKQTGFEIVYTKYVSKKLSLRSFVSHILVNLGISKKLDLYRIPNLPIHIPINPFYKLLVIARKTGNLNKAS
ncbi:MAG: class I SAM-dependent methyltransferase [bacterium]